MYVRSIAASAGLPAGADEQVACAVCGGVGNIASLGGQMPLVSEFKIGEWGIFGYQGFLLTGVAYDVGVFAYFFFQMVFMDTTCTIPTGGELRATPARSRRWI